MRIARIVCGSATAALLAVPIGVIASGDERPGVRVVAPADLKWKASPRARGVLIAVLVGDPTKPERYIMRAKYLTNTVNRPHHHPVDEEITVLSGTWYMGRGETLDTAEAVPLRPGTFIFQPAKAWHWMLTKSEPVEVEIHGVGPRTNIYAK
jgi:quercetin dioxygenase-like cupin family protein